MRRDFDCPVCRSRAWETTGTYRFVRGQTVREGPRAFTTYVGLRRRILFEVWFPGLERIELESVMCAKCGFMCYVPRPSEADIDAKYRFLQTAEGNIGGQKSDPRLHRLDEARSRRIFRATTLHAGDAALRVLDFGGGDGKLLRPFVAGGHDCALVDYNVRPLDGVRKIGDTLDDVPRDARFDVIIASHILEHLAEPGQAVSRLAGHLADRGVIYGEVPLGVWGGIGIENDPVTHINFFNGASFRSLFEKQGLRVVDHRQMVGVYNRRMDVVLVVAAKGTSEDTRTADDGPRETRRLLAPSTGMKIARLWRLRRFPTIRGALRRLGI